MWLPEHGAIVGIFGPVTLMHENPATPSAHRFACPGAADFVVPKNVIQYLEYDRIARRWRPLA